MMNIGHSIKTSFVLLLFACLLTRSLFFLTSFCMQLNEHFVCRRSAATASAAEREREREREKETVWMLL